MGQKMIDGHVITRALINIAAIAIPIWLLGDRAELPVASGPVIRLAATRPTPLPTRSLFAPSPITGEARPGENVPALTGIAGRPPDDAVALLRLRDGSTRGLSKGGVADGWTVAEIAADRVRLTRAGRDHVEILQRSAYERQ